MTAFDEAWYILKAKSPSQEYWRMIDRLREEPLEARQDMVDRLKAESSTIPPNPVPYAPPGGPIGVPGQNVPNAELSNDPRYRQSNLSEYGA